MLGGCSARGGISVTDPDAARKFYEGVLGIPMSEVGAGSDRAELALHLGDGTEIRVVTRGDHLPSRYPVLTFRVDDIETVVAALQGSGVDFLRYDGYDQDENGVVRAVGEPSVAWFGDPSGNVLSLEQEQ